MRVSNNNKDPNKNRKPLTKNQKIIAIIFIVGGGLFLLNQILFRIDQARWENNPRKAYCDELLNENYSLYKQVCNE